MKAQIVQKHIAVFLFFIMVFSVTFGVQFSTAGQTVMRNADGGQGDPANDDEDTTGALDPIDEAKVAAAVALINGIGDVAHTAECRAKINAARSAYDALNRREKQLISNYGTLLIAENTFNNLTQEHNIAIQFVVNGAVEKFIDPLVDRVYFGVYNLQSNAFTDPVPWRVLNSANGRMLLLSDKTLLYDRFHLNSTAAVSWASCSLHTKLNGSDTGMVGATDNSFVARAFNSVEKNVIWDTDVYAIDHPGSASQGGMGTGDKVFILSSEEVMNPAYGFPASTAASDARAAQGTAVVHLASSSNGAESTWRLRDTGSGTSRWVHRTGEVAASNNTEDYNQNDYRGVRPAINIDLSRVLLLSPAAGGKNANGALAAVPAFSGSEWKLTVRDNSYQFTVTQTGATVVQGDTVSLDYTKAKYGTNDYISAILVNADGKSLYYGKITQAADEAGTVNITVPTDLPPGTYTLRVFNEQVNDDYYTDRGSAFSDVTLTVTCAHNWRKIRTVGNCETGLTYHFLYLKCGGFRTEDENEPKEHTWAEDHREGNCIAGWTVYYKCSVCFAESSGHEDGPGSHDWTEDRREGSDEDGWTVYYRCSNCTCTTTQFIPPREYGRESGHHRDQDHRHSGIYRRV